MAHQVNKRMMKDVQATIYAATNTGQYHWPECVLGAAQYIGNLIGANVDNGIQAQEMMAVAQKMIVQTAHTVHVAKNEGSSSIILPE